MPANQSTWTDERVERLKSRFEAGLSCREIAVDIGVSRNAVIGKLSRLNLTREENGDERHKARKSGAKGPRVKAARRLQYQILLGLYAERQSVTDEPIRDEHHCSLLELSEARCRWPINTPGAEDFCFCGDLPIKSLPYCAGHARLAYRQNSLQRARAQPGRAFGHPLARERSKLLDLK
jgi:GcrA cell cycle regulator